MKKTILVSVVIMLLIACHNKAVPVITSRNAPPPILPVEKQTSNTVADAVAGKTIYTTRCGHCHGLPDPMRYTAQRWDGILSSMIPKAKLTSDEGNNVTAYVKANCPK
jgi:mono/diheme cytochrome c family protein